MKYTLVWDIPGVWRGLEKLKPLERDILYESRYGGIKTAERVIQFASNYLGISEKIAESNLRHLRRFIYLLFLGQDYGEGHKFWKNLNSLNEEQEFFDSFKRILSLLNLFQPEAVPGNSRVNLILLHTLVPPKSARKFVEMSKYLYRKLNKEEKLLSLEKEELQKLISNAPTKIRAFIYACRFNETFYRLREILYEIFKFLGGEISYPNIPDWLLRELYSDQEVDLNEGIEDRFAKLMSKYSYIFLNAKKQKIPFTKEGGVLVLSEDPAYLLIRTDLYNNLEEEWFDSFDIREDKDYGDYKLLSIWGSIEGWEIEGLEIGIGSFGKLIELEGEEVDIFIPVHDRGKVFSGYFSIKPSHRVKELLIKTPASIFTLDDLPEYFTEPGRYEVFYRDKKRTVQVIYLLPDRPELVESFNVLYRGKVYQPGEEVEESFGKFIVSYGTVKKLLRREIKFFDERSKKIYLPSFPEGLRAYLFNRCGERLYSFNSGGELSLSEIPERELIFPLQLIFYFKNRRIGKLTIGRKRRDQQCPLARIIELLLKESLTGSNSLTLGKINLTEFPQDSELSEKEVKAIKKFLPSNLAVSGELGRTFVRYLKRALENKAVEELFKVRRDPYLRRLANRYLKLEE